MTELVKEISHVNFMIDHESLDYVAYEFETKEEIQDEYEGSLFQLHVVKGSNDIYIYNAYSQDYSIMEEVSEYFDEQAILQAILAEVGDGKSEEFNRGEVFIRYCELVDEGYEDGDAAFKAEVEILHKD